jgi:hypothetical protein
VFSSVLAGEPECLFLNRENETAAGQLIAYRQIMERVQLRAMFMKHVIAQSCACVKSLSAMRLSNRHVAWLGLPEINGLGRFCA